MANSVLPINPDLNKKTNLKTYIKQRQFNLNKKQDFSSVNQHVAKMFELLAFNGVTLNIDEDPMNVSTDDENVNHQNENPTENPSSSSTSTNTPNTPSPSSSSNTDIVFKNDKDMRLSDLTNEESTVDSPNCASGKFDFSTSVFNSITFDNSNPDQQFKEICMELMSLYTRIPTPDSNLLKSFGFFCEDLTKVTGPQYRSVKTSPTPHALYLFMCSILRTNLETELLVKLSKSLATGAKKSCFVPLFHVLALNCHFLIPQYYTSLWSQLTGLTVPEDFRESIVQVDKEVPLLLVDTSAILIQLLFALPLNIDEKYYDSIVKNLYNLTAFQAICQISCFFTKDERKTMLKQLDRNQLFSSTTNMIAYIVDYFEVNNTKLYSHMEKEENDQLLGNKRWKPNELDELAMNMCLPFVRIASLLKCFLFNREYPCFSKLTEDQLKKSEYHNLTRVFNLKAAEDRDDAFVMPNLICNEPTKLLNIWLNQYSIFLENSLSDAVKLLHFKPISFVSPKLLNLPPTYDQLFLHYYQKPCSNCNTCPKEPCICFLCASLVCMRQECCRKSDGSALEAAHHSQICGAGTALYLAVYSSTVIVIRGRRACVWGSVYLDMHGEEDRDLKRGRPLYLSQLRYNVLEQQWLTHSFDHTNKRFVLHKDMI